MNRCKYCGKLLTLTPEFDTCIECQGRIMRELTILPQNSFTTNLKKLSMNIYDEALELVITKVRARESGSIEKEKIIKALEHAKKEHELLELYRELNKSRIAYYTTKDKRVMLDEHTNIMMMEGAINDLEKELEELK